MSELSLSEFNASLISASAVKEKIIDRKTIVYQTLIDPTIVRIEGEKNKHKLFKRYLFKLTTPEEIEFSSIEKYYEPYIVVSGKHLIDYYRKCAYSVIVAKEAKEIILFDRTFIPKQTPYSNADTNSITLEGEERIVKETQSFIILDRRGRDIKVSDFSSAPSEENTQELIKLFRMPEIAPDADLEIVRKRIVYHPNDISRLVNEELEIDERSVIYAPRFKLTYKCQKLDKEAYIVFDGVTLKQIQENESMLSAGINALKSAPKRLFDKSEKWITKRLQSR